MKETLFRRSVQDDRGKEKREHGPHSEGDEIHRSFASRYKAEFGKHCSGARSRMTKGEGHRLEQTATFQNQKVRSSQDDKKGEGIVLSKQQRCNCKKSQP